KEKELTVVERSIHREPFYERAKTFKLPITRIIALDDNDGEPLRLLGAEDLVVGVGTSLVTHPIILPEMSKLPTVGSGFGAGIDYEKVISLEPDLFMAVAAWPLKGLEEKLEPAGVQVLLLNFHVITETIEDVRKVGYLIDKVDKAEEFAEFHDDAVDNIRARTDGLSEDKKPLIFIINFWGYEGGIGLTTGKGTKHDYMCNYAGGINIARDLGGSTKVDPEWVLEQNPDIIVTCVYGIGQGYGAEDTTKMKAVRDEIMNLPGWDNIKAVKNGNVYIISTDLTQSGLIGFIATAYWAKWFQPDLFEDLDPEAIHQEYVDRFIRIDYDVKNGVFVYPPLGD
ncbi:MAG: ABC transporter substrate-binding protein, partial [Methanophagales archaeon]|nr:ABC transporter substrate-binding protein [Methanophagales archaeon]